MNLNDSPYKYGDKNNLNNSFININNNTNNKNNNNSNRNYSDIIQYNQNIMNNRISSINNHNNTNTNTNNNNNNTQNTNHTNNTMSNNLNHISSIKNIHHTNNNNTTLNNTMNTHNMSNISNIKNINNTNYNNTHNKPSTKLHKAKILRRFYSTSSVSDSNPNNSSYNKDEDIENENNLINNIVNSTKNNQSSNVKININSSNAKSNNNPNINAVKNSNSNIHSNLNSNSNLLFKNQDQDSSHFLVESKTSPIYNNNNYNPTNNINTNTNTNTNIQSHNISPIKSTKNHILQNTNLNNLSNIDDFKYLEENSYLKYRIEELNKTHINSISNINELTKHSKSLESDILQLKDTIKELQIKNACIDKHRSEATINNIKLQEIKSINSLMEESLSNLHKESQDKEQTILEFKDLFEVAENKFQKYEEIVVDLQENKINLERRLQDMHINLERYSVNFEKIKTEKEISNNETLKKLNEVNLLLIQEEEKNKNMLSNKDKEFKNKILNREKEIRDNIINEFKELNEKVEKLILENEKLKIKNATNTNTNINQINQLKINENPIPIQNLNNTLLNDTFSNQINLDIAYTQKDLEISKLKKTITKLERLLEEQILDNTNLKNNDILGLNTTIYESNVQINELKQEILVYKANYDTYKDELKLIKSEKTVLETEKENLIEKISNQHNTINKYEQKLEVSCEITEKSSELTQKMENLLHKNKDLNNYILHMEAEVEEYKRIEEQLINANILNQELEIKISKQNEIENMINQYEENLNELSSIIHDDMRKLEEYQLQEKDYIKNLLLLKEEFLLVKKKFLVEFDRMYMVVSSGIGSGVGGNESNNNNNLNISNIKSQFSEIQEAILDLFQRLQTKFDNKIDLFKVII